MLLLYIAVGGAVGSMCRYLATHWLKNIMGREFPYATLMVNIAGSLLLGAVIAMLVLWLPRARDLHALLAVGFLGGFTTFSAFSMDLYLLMERGEWLNGAVYAVSSVCFSVIAFFIGMWLVRAVA